MCPYDSLVGCQQEYGETSIRDDAVYDELYNIAQGIFLNIDNNLLEECQNIANEAMIAVCGDTDDCTNLTVDDNIGARSLDYKICEYSNSDNSLDINYSRCRTDESQILDTELGRVEGSTTGALRPVTPFAGVIDGTIYWNSVEINEDGRLSTVDQYLEQIGETNISAAAREKIESELAVLQSNIDTAINTIEADSRVQFCMTGREVQGVRVVDRGQGGSGARFPNLTKQMRMTIANAALKRAKDNYYRKYDELNERMLQDYAKLGERMAEIQGENALDARREIARIACINFAEMSSLPKSPDPPKNAFGKVLSAVALLGSAVAMPFTAGVVGVAGVATAGIGLLGNVGSGSANGADASIQRELVGSKQLNQWNYKETIT